MGAGEGGFFSVRFRSSFSAEIPQAGIHRQQLIRHRSTIKTPYNNTVFALFFIQRYTKVS